jgi:hypothetical protein
MSKNLPNEFTYNNLNKQIELLQQELDVNLQQKVLVNQRISLIKASLKDIPNTDPDYSIFFTQLEMDQIELDELQNREEEIKRQINTCK